MIWGTVGPLAEPSNRSGVHAGPNRRCSCTPDLGQSCDRCDGCTEEAYQISRCTPAEQRAFAADMAVWKARRDSRAAADLTTNPSGDAA